MVDFPRRLRRLALATALLLAVAGGMFVARRPVVETVGPGVTERVGFAPDVVNPPPVSPPPAPAPGPVSAPAAPVFAPGALFAYASPADAAALDAALPAPTRAIHYVRVNAALVAGKQSPFWQKPGAGRVALPLPGGGALSVVIDGSEMLGADRFTSSGHLEGRPQGRAVFAWNEGFLHASITDPELGSYALRAATGEFAQFYQIDPALVPPCGGARLPVIDAGTLAAAAARRARAADLGAAAPLPAAPGPAFAAAENPQHAEIHVMMAYTPAVLATLTGATRTAALQSGFDAAIAKVNSDFAASLITARVKLVQIAETQYDENASASGSVQNDALTALYLTGDGKMDELHALRDRVGADLVCLALNRQDFASTGLAFLLNQPGDNLNALFGFSVVQYSNVAATSVVAHELGHNLGCAHDRLNAPGPGAYPYSYGYRFFGADGRQYHDIMSYPPGTEVAYFSNPGLTAPAPASAVLGIALGQPGESDTALTIEQDAFEVSTFRLQTQAAPNPGTLINVSTRAYVGPGEQALIGGFVIAGTAPKKMLIRAAGPALAAFGVPGTLADPVLDLYSGAAVFQSNDNWAAQAGPANAADLAAAAAQTGAFAFAPGSADAALLVTLPPGPYTAVVRGAGGTTGAALVEAYEVERTVNKIVNLSTRGYADNVDRPMSGSFVVEGGAGATKRILLRVLGPSLAQFGVAGAMFDPCMEVHNAAGDLLLKNDDWSTGAGITAGARDDFKPTVHLYNEQQISATGFAPGNRREPCVMADLPPGSYTVIVKPFEKLDDTPPQIAEPGVALVEVYEINP